MGGRARLAWSMAGTALEVTDIPSCTHSMAQPWAWPPPSQGVRYLNTITSPVPSSSSRFSHAIPVTASSSSSCPQAALLLVMLRAKRWVGSSPICVCWLTPFTPYPPTRGRGAGMAQWGCQGAPHGLGKGRRKCPVKCSIALGWMGPAQGPAPAVGHL